MRCFKIILFVLFSSAASSFLAGQTLAGISGGFALVRPIDNATHNNGDVVSDISGKLSYSLLLEIKGRKPKKFHPGASLMFYQSCYNWYARGSGYMADGLDINYKIDYLRFSVFPEFTLGDRFQFFCNLGPYISFMVHSSRNGTSWSYKYIDFYPREVTETETGSASEDIKTVDFGVQGSVGINCSILPWLGLTCQENCSFGFINVNKTDLGGKQRNFNLSFLFGVSFKVPANNSQSENEPVK